MGYLLLMMSIYFFIKNDKKKLFIILLFSIFALPNNAYIKESLLMNVFHIDVMYYIIFILLALEVIKKIKSQSVNINPTDIFFSMFILYFCVYALIGISNRNVFFYEDVKTYLTILLMYLVIRTSVKKESDVSFFINTIIFMSVIYSLSIIIINSFFSDSLNLIYGERLSAWWAVTERIAFGNTSFLLLTSSLLYYKTVSKDYNFRIYSLLALIVNSYAILLSQNRTLIILSVVSIFMIQLYIVIKIIKMRQIKLSEILFTMCIFFFVSIFLVMSLDNLFVNNNFIEDLRLRFTTNLNTIDVRSNGNGVAWERIKSNKIGEGVGAPLTAYSSDWKYAFEGNFIDNTFMTLGVKFGIVGLLLFIYFMINSVINLYLYYKKNRDGIFMVLFICYGLSLILVAYMNAQIIYTTSLSFIFLLFLSLKNVK